MKSRPPLRIQFNASRLAAACVCVAGLASALLLAWLPGHALARTCGVIAIGVFSLRLLRSWAARSAPASAASIEVSPDGHIAVTTRAGRRIEGAIRAETYVGAGLTSIVWRPEGSRFSRSIAIVSDMLPSEDFRRLRVLLRFLDAST
jgi:hypothetical protein